MLSKGQSPIEGFEVVESRPGRFELQREITPGVVVRFSGEKAISQAAAWVADQARRKDGGALA